MQLSMEQIQSVSFDSVADFRIYNPAGYAELTERLEKARKNYREADSLQEKEIAQTRIESLENLWRLSNELARERFERSRDGVAGRLNDLDNQVKSSRLPVHVLEGLRTKLAAARQAFLRKQFAGAEETISAIQSGLRQVPRRRMTVAIPDVPRTAPRPAAVVESINLHEQKQFVATEGTASKVQPERRQAPRRRVAVAIPDVPRTAPRPAAAVESINLLELAHRQEKAGSRTDACRSYVKVLERQVGNVVALRQ